MTVREAVVLCPIDSHSIAATVWPTPRIDPVFELFRIKIPNVAATGYTVIGALYHPPSPLYKSSDLLDHTEAAVSQVQHYKPKSQLFLAGDSNSLSNVEAFIKSDFNSTAHRPTRGNSELDRLYILTSKFINEQTNTAIYFFVSPRSKRALVIPTPVVYGIERVESIKVLRFPNSRKFSVALHIDSVL